MTQQIIALIFIAFFLARVVWQKQKKQISPQEFIFWLLFWLIAGLAILSLKTIDQLVAQIGFSGSGIEVLLYLSVAILFYLVFRLRLKLEKIDRSITRLVRDNALNEHKITDKRRQTTEKK